VNGDDLAGPENGDLAYAGNAASRYGNLTHAGNADNAYDGAAGPVPPDPEPPDPEPPDPEPPDPEPEPAPPPVASFTYDPPAPKRGDYTDFDGSGSAPGDAEVPVTRYDWQFADKAEMDDAGPAVTWRVPGAYGTYPVTLTVTASDGQQGAAVRDIVLSVEEEVPSA
jgi:hypothetical protein